MGIDGYSISFVSGNRAGRSPSGQCGVRSKGLGICGSIVVDSNDVLMCGKVKIQMCLDDLFNHALLQRLFRDAVSLLM